MTALLPGLSGPGGALPVRAVLPAVVEAATSSGSAVLLSPPGTGKTTLLPLALADALAGRVLVAEPRRIAARAAATRMATLVGDPVGGVVGFSIRGERVVSAATRIEVVTTGLLVQRLQADPELSGVSAVVLDECHERHLDTDLALAFCADVRAGLREDLAVLATSATLAAAPIARLLGGDTPAPVIEAESPLHPVAIRWASRPTLPFGPDGRITREFLDEVAATVRGAMAEESGDVLVFLPGEAELRGVADRLASIGADVLRLSGRSSAEEQRRALVAGPRRRVVLSTAVAESSVTVDGVRIVVDAGLSREPRTDHERGLGRLVTVRVSQASAAQRAGRAGRQGPGTLHRLWTEAEHGYLAATALPELATADLTGYALSLAAWGTPAGVGLAQLERPPAAALDAAIVTLTALGAVDRDGHITERGRAMQRIGSHPRLARALLDGASEIGVRLAAELVALLDSDTPTTRASDDLTAAWRAIRAGRDNAGWREEARRLRQRVPAELRGAADASRSGADAAAALITGLAFPERLARRRSEGGTSYLTVGGTGAGLGPGTALSGSTWLAVAVADRPTGRADARIRLAAPIEESVALRLAACAAATRPVLEWQAGAVRLVSADLLGAITLRERPLRSPDLGQVLDTVAAGLTGDGLDGLGWSPSGRRLRDRLAVAHRHLGEPWPDVSDTALISRIRDWLGPEVAKALARLGNRDRLAVAGLDPEPGLSRLVGWPTLGRLAELVPDRITVPTGSSVAVDYADPDRPTAAVRLQETFGWTETPRIAGGRLGLVLELLSPAGRPVAVTADLGSFWANGYRVVRAELRGRYPKHFWPEDPLTATPTRGVRRSSR